MDGELLINAVFARPPIWQSRHKHYRNRGVIEKLWDEIGRAMNTMLLCITIMEPCRKKGKTIHSEAREVIRHVIQECDEEAREGQLKHLLRQTNLRVSNYTGISVSTVSRIRKESTAAGDTSLSTPGKHRPQPEERKVQCDGFNRDVIREVIQDFYVVQKKEKIKFPWGVHSLRRILRDMGFKWKKCQNFRKILVERPNIVSWRCRYLRAMRRYRSDNRSIVYIDETWVDNNLTFNKCWQSDNQPGVMTNRSSSNRLIIVHAGCEDGFLEGALVIFKAGKTSGDYHGQMNAENFEKWIREKLLPNLPKNSVIVLDNASYHCVQQNKPPTKYAVKKEMKSWLERNYVPYGEDMRKSELFHLIEINKGPEKIFRIDEMSRSHGHDVIRLPPYMCEFNAIELAWSKAKRIVRESNVTGDISMAKLEAVTRTAISSITKADWEGYCSHVRNSEEEYWKNDGLMEDALEEFIISLDSDSNESSEDQFSSSESELAHPLTDSE
ncbi:uncharacterized protein [Anabrus simplex]|uniref:uncharacterized protein n=1 Tax=Anabrus simplex TaxID=316456 RepID=UPI0035A2BCD2